MADKIITSIKDVPVANEELYAEVARINKMTVTEVRQIISFVGHYTADVIRSGVMSDVMLPHFGKIRVKKKVLYTINQKKMDRRSGKDIIKAALKGKAVKDRRQQ